MIALFDMDGTLFPGDSQLRFARRILRRHKWRRAYLLLVLPGALLRALRILSTEQMKRLFLTYAWRISAEELERECREFVQQELIPALYPEVVQRLEEHRKAGDITVLCSASPDWWTRPMGEAMGFTHTIGTPVSLGRCVPFFPSIPRPGNNKGANKTVRLAAIGITCADVGYTDSKADEPMLSLCSRVVLVNPRSSFAAAHPQAEILRPSNRIRTVSFCLGCILGCGFFEQQKRNKTL